MEKENSYAQQASQTIRCWIIEVGEPLPMPNTIPRLMRAGQIATRLNEMVDIDVTWWVSDFNHTGKTHYDLSGILDAQGGGTLSNGVRARFLHGRGYKRNLSVSRLLHNRDVSRDFKRQIKFLPRPDLIFCCYPTIDLAYASAAYGARYGVPVVLDVRDLWPDAFVDALPFPKALTRVLITPLQLKARLALRRATSISAISEPILKWALTKAGRARHARDRVLPLSYEPPALSQESRAAAEHFWQKQGLRLNGSEFIACCFGMLSNVPEFETVVECLQYIPQDLARRLRIVICGHGERLSWLIESSRRYPQLVVPGYVDGAAIASLMPHAFAGLLPYPSRDDLTRSYPNKIGEYLAGHLPVISTLSGASADLLTARDCGIVVRNRDAPAFAEALISLATDESRRIRMKHNAASTFAEIFDARKNYAQMANFLRTLAREPKNVV